MAQSQSLLASENVAGDHADKTGRAESPLFLILQCVRSLGPVRNGVCPCLSNAQKIRSAGAGQGGSAKGAQGREHPGGQAEGRRGWPARHPGGTADTRHTAGGGDGTRTDALKTKSRKIEPPDACQKSEIPQGRKGRAGLREISAGTREGNFAPPLSRAREGKEGNAGAALRKAAPRPA